VGRKDIHFPKALYEEQFVNLKPLNWTVNFSDGKSGNKKQYKDFHLIPEERRKEIRSMRIQSGDKQITISRKVGDRIVEGFFYHILAGRKTAMGSIIGLDIGYFEERIGFCYNNNGDGMCVKIDHSSYIVAVKKKFDKIRDIIAGLPNNHPELQGNNINLDNIPEVVKILDANIVSGLT
jgi:hypothetical protein